MDRKNKRVQNRKLKKKKQKKLYLNKKSKSVGNSTFSKSAKSLKCKNVQQCFYLNCRNMFCERTNLVELTSPISRRKTN